MGCWWLPFLSFYKRCQVTKISKVKVKIESSIDNLDSAGLPEGDTEKNFTEAEGFFKYSENEAVLTYAEENEGGRAESEIIIANGCVRVKRKGAIESDMYFKEGETSLSIYSVPPYKFDMSVFAKRVRISLDENGGKIDLLYNMKIGGAEKSARMKIWILQPSNQI